MQTLLFLKLLESHTAQQCWPDIRANVKVNWKPPFLAPHRAGHWFP